MLTSKGKAQTLKKKTITIFCCKNKGEMRTLKLKWITSSRQEAKRFTTRWKKSTTGKLTRSASWLKTDCIKNLNRKMASSISFRPCPPANFQIGPCLICCCRIHRPDKPINLSLTIKTPQSQQKISQAWCAIESWRRWAAFILKRLAFLTTNKYHRRVSVRKKKMWLTRL